jgi:hypothetical protein
MTDEQLHLIRNLLQQIDEVLDEVEAPELDAAFASAWDALEVQEAEIDRDYPWINDILRFC